ncbi:hypothetical protein [Duganella levis]|uniref:Uncharacterized protein n=1 Tax=Duganella levis TaxID=2692169 RepID=A0ABW9W7W9_9BURK|nr:hypothetical protein [Duganella levis]MYN30172.1 hypothetical protein [Duganella levis]
MRQHLALSIEAMRSDMALRDDAQRAHVNLRLEYLRSEINRHIYEQGRMARDRAESLQQELIRLASQP